MNFGSRTNEFLNFPAKKVATGKNSDLDNLPLNLSLNVNLLYPIQQASNFSSRILHFADWQNLEKKESNNLLNQEVFAFHHALKGMVCSRLLDAQDCIHPCTEVHGFLHQQSWHNNLLINPLMNNIFIELKGGETG